MISSRRKWRKDGSTRDVQRSSDGYDTSLSRFQATHRDFKPLLASLRSMSSPATNGEPPTGPTTTIPITAMPLISPNALLYAHLTQQPPKRPSGRSISECRPIDLNIGSLTPCNGSSLVRIGATTMVCGVRAEILPVSEIPSYRVSNAPSTSTSTNSYNPVSLYSLLVPNLELSTGCSPLHLANTAPSSEAQSLSQRLLSLLLTSNLISPSDLEILHTPPQETSESLADTNPQLKAYWVLYIDILCISHGDSLFDAAWLSLYAALRDTVLPKAWWDADAEKVLCSPEIHEARKLGLRGMPVPLSFGAFVPETMVLRAEEAAERKWVLVDTDAFEEECCEESGCVTVDLDEDGDVEIVRVEKIGGEVVEVAEVEELMETAGERWRAWKSVLEGALKGNG